jgi:hypothetical protein
MRKGVKPQGTRARIRTDRLTRNRSADEESYKANEEIENADKETYKYNNEQKRR